MIQVQCPKCARTFQVPPKWAGKTAKCKHCQTRIPIPDGRPESGRPDTVTFATGISATAAPETATEMNVMPDVSEPAAAFEPVVTSDALLNAVPASIEPVRLAPGYMLSLIVVAALLVLLPVLYIALAGLVAYGVYWHFAHGQWLFQTLGGGQVRGKGAILAVIAWAAPGVIGAILVLFMVKPLFHRRPQRGNPFSVPRKNEPVLYEFVERLCDCVGAPYPVRIDLTNDVNASASFVSPAGLFNNKLVLTIGLPLVAGLPLKHFAGVLAHEFGHFSQFWAMRLMSVIETVNDWFRRVVDERDAWDEQLEAWSRNIDLRVGWVLYVAQFFVWLVRRILAGFRLLGLFFSRRLSREMEFNADQFEVRVVGSRAFAETFERLAVLGLAESVSERAASQFLREGRALDDFARFVVYQAGELKPDKLKPLLERVRNQPAPWQSTHPSDAERIARGAATEAAGPFALDAPARLLFRDFHATSRELTRRGYRRNDGQEVSLEELTAVDDLIAEQQRRRASYESALCFALQVDAALDRFRCTDGALATDTDTEALWNAVRSARQTLERERSAYLAAAAEWQRWWNIYTRLQLARLNVALGEPAPPPSPDGLPWAIKSMDDIDARMAEFEQQSKAWEDRRAAFDEALSARMRADLQLAERIAPDAERRIVDEARRLWSALQGQSSAVPGMRELQVRLLQIESLFSRPVNPRQREAVPKLVEALREATVNELKDLWGHLMAFQYPFDLPHPVEHLAAGLLSHLEDEQNPVAVYRDVEQFCSGFWSLWRRTLGRLAEIAQQVEATGGLPPVTV